jgi:hypothetical protein
VKPFLIFSVVALIACGGDGTPTSPISPSALEGSYAITLSGTPRSCDVLQVTVSASGTWTGGECGFAGSRVTVKGDSLLLGNPDGSVDFKFFALASRGAEVLSQWLGPCTIPLGGGLPGCERESGSATWVRP